MARVGGVTPSWAASAEQDGDLEQEEEGDAGQSQWQRPGRALLCEGGDRGFRGAGRMWVGALWGADQPPRMGISTEHPEKRRSGLSTP